MIENLAGEEKESDDVLKCWLVLFSKIERIITIRHYFFLNFRMRSFFQSSLFRGARRKENHDAFKKIECIDFHPSVEIWKAERLNILMFEKFQPDLERLIPEKNIPLFAINIMRDFTQFLAKNDIRQISINNTAILIELIKFSLLYKMHEHQGRQFNFHEHHVEQILESKITRETSNNMQMRWNDFILLRVHSMFKSNSKEYHDHC